MARDMPRADTPEVARPLSEYAQRSALRGGNPYWAKTFSRAADSLSHVIDPGE
jgi:DNA polymerase (family 10)